MVILSFCIEMSATSEKFEFLSLNRTLRGFIYSSKGNQRLRHSLQKKIRKTRFREKYDITVSASNIKLLYKLLQAIKNNREYGV